MTVVRLNCMNTRLGISSLKSDHNSGGVKWYRRRHHFEIPAGPCLRAPPLRPVPADLTSLPKKRELKALVDRLIAHEQVSNLRSGGTFLEAPSYPIYRSL